MAKKIILNTYEQVEILKQDLERICQGKSWALDTAIHDVCSTLAVTDKEHFFEELEKLPDMRHFTDREYEEWEVLELRSAMRAFGQHLYQQVCTLGLYVADPEGKMICPYLSGRILEGGDIVVYELPY